MTDKLQKSYRYFEKIMTYTNLVFRTNALNFNNSKLPQRLEEKKVHKEKLLD